MALLHDATIQPTKRDLVAEWLPSRPWFDGVLERGPVATFRLDDPEGQVGMEGFILGSPAGSTLFVPLTYRGAPLDGAEEHLLGTMEHSVLGRRWVYDACEDPVWVATVTSTILTGGAEAKLEMEVAGAMQTLPSSASVRDSGDGSTAVGADDLELTVARVVGTPLEGAHTLTGDWGWGSGVLAALS